MSKNTHNQQVQSHNSFIHNLMDSLDIMEPRTSQSKEMIQQFGEYLKTLREIKGYTRQELASKIGIDKSQIIIWENGSFSPHKITPDMLFTLALALNEDINVFYKLLNLETTEQNLWGQLREALALNFHKLSVQIKPLEFKQDKLFIKKLNLSINKMLLKNTISLNKLAYLCTTQKESRIAYLIYIVNQIESIQTFTHKPNLKKHINWVAPVTKNVSEKYPDNVRLTTANDKIDKRYKQINYKTVTLKQHAATPAAA